MSRITRLKERSREVCHGVLEWDIYEEWRGRERGKLNMPRSMRRTDGIAARYPMDAFPYLSALVPSDLYHQVLTPLFRLLARFAAHSHLSGLTPQALSSLFAPLLFDIPTSAPALAAHATFVRAASASEHLLLAFIRSQSSSKSELGVKDLPTRLREWVNGYPSMLASDADLARGNPRKGAKIIRCERASRLVRAYTRDLVLHAELWAGDLPNDQKWDQWDRVILQHRKGEVSRPKFSQAWRRKMAVKENLPLPASASDSLERHTTYGKARTPGRKEEKRERKKSDEEEGRYGSLAGKEWTLFEEGGFDAPSEREKSDMKSRLQFDLTESAKNASPPVVTQEITLTSRLYRKRDKRWIGPNSHPRQADSPVPTHTSLYRLHSPNHLPTQSHHGHPSEKHYSVNCINRKRTRSHFSMIPLSSWGSM
jgi:hypothetical protein